MEPSDEAAARAWVTAHSVACLRYGQERGLALAYLAGIRRERQKNRRLILSMAKRIAAQSEKLTRKAKATSPRGR